MNSNSKLPPLRFRTRDLLLLMVVASVYLTAICHTLRHAHGTQIKAYAIGISWVASGALGGHLVGGWFRRNRALSQAGESLVQLRTLPPWKLVFFWACVFVVGGRLLFGLNESSFVSYGVFCTLSFMMSIYSVFRGALRLTAKGVLLETLGCYGFAPWDHISFASISHGSSGHIFRCKRKWMKVTAWLPEEHLRHVQTILDEQYHVAGRRKRTKQIAALV